jgi:hypothetical protein
MIFLFFPSWEAEFLPIEHSDSREISEILIQIWMDDESLAGEVRGLPLEDDVEGVVEIEYDHSGFEEFGFDGHAISPFLPRLI